MIYGQLFKSSVLLSATCQISTRFNGNYSLNSVRCIRPLKPQIWTNGKKSAIEATRESSVSLGNNRYGYRYYTAAPTQIKGKTTTRKVMAKLTEQERNEQLQPLLKAGWSMVTGRDAIYKEYLFADFNQAFSFMAGAALLAEKINHHPEWFNVYNKVQVTMSTHDVGGLSAKDIRMASYMEEQAKRF